MSSDVGGNKAACRETTVETSLKRESLQGDRVKGLRSSPLTVIAATEWGGLGRYWRGASTYNFILLKPHGSWNNCRPHGLGWLREIAARSRIMYPQSAVEILLTGIIQDCQKKNGAKDCRTTHAHRDWAEAKMQYATPR